MDGNAARSRYEVRVDGYMTYLNGPLGVLLAGSAGAVLLLLLHRAATWRARLTELIAGMITSFFIAPAIVKHWFHSDSLEMRMAISLAVGCLGPIIAGSVVRVVERRADGDVERLVDRTIGKRESKE